MALINARSYFRKVREKFYRDSHSLENEIRDYVNTFGFLQKNVNGLDILIEVFPTAIPKATQHNTH